MKKSDVRKKVKDFIKSLTDEELSILIREGYFESEISKISERMSKSICKKLFDKFPEYNAICIGRVGKAYDAPYEEVVFDITWIEENPGIDGYKFMNEKLNEMVYEGDNEIEKIIDEIGMNLNPSDYCDSSNVYPGHGYFVFIDSDLDIKVSNQM